MEALKYEKVKSSNAAVCTTYKHASANPWFISLDALRQKM